jgi:hypothetical protein
MKIHAIAYSCCGHDEDSHKSPNKKIIAKLMMAS